MLERFFVRPRTIDHIRSSWIGEGIVQYVTWLTTRSFSAAHRLSPSATPPAFGAFARSEVRSNGRNCPSTWTPSSRLGWRTTPGHATRPRHATRLLWKLRTPVEQMLRLMLKDFRGRGRPHKSHPFGDVAPNFFAYLRDERGLRDSSLKLYAHYLHRFAAYLNTIGFGRPRRDCRGGE